MDNVKVLIIVILIISLIVSISYSYYLTVRINGEVKKSREFQKDSRLNQHKLQRVQKQLEVCNVERRDSRRQIQDPPNQSPSQSPSQPQFSPTPRISAPSTNRHNYIGPVSSVVDNEVIMVQRGVSS